jgi:hypothetical protein
MDRSAFERCAGSSAIPARANRVLRYPLLESRSSVKGRGHPQQLTIETEDESPVGSAHSDRTLGHGLKHCLEIECRAADYFEHLRRGRLLLQRLGEFAGALLLRLEQPGVLDRDYRLISEGFDQFYLLLRERPYRNTLQNDQTNWNPPRRSGTPRIVRKLPTLANSRSLKSGSERTSGT